MMVLLSAACARSRYWVTVAHRCCRDTLYLSSPPFDMHVISCDPDVIVVWWSSEVLESVKDDCSLKGQRLSDS